MNPYVCLLVGGMVCLSDMIFSRAESKTVILLSEHLFILPVPFYNSKIFAMSLLGATYNRIFSGKYQRTLPLHRFFIFLDKYS